MNQQDDQYSAQRSVPQPAGTVQGQQPPQPYGYFGYHQPYYGDPISDLGIFGPLHPSRFMRVLRRKWKIIVLMMILASAAASFYLWTTPKTYRAVSLIEMSQRRPRIMNSQTALIEDPGYAAPEEVFNTRLKKFAGPAFKECAVIRFKAANPDLSLTDSEVNGLLGGAGFMLLAKTRIVQVTYEHTTPRLAAAAANAFAEATEVYTIEENRAASDSAVAWLQAQANAARTQLEKTEKTLVEFRMEHKLDVLESEKTSGEDAVLSLSKSIIEAESREVMARNMSDSLRELEIKPETAGKLPDSVPRVDEIRSAVERLTAAVAERDTLMSRFTEKHPEVLSRQNSIAVLRTRISDAIKSAKETAMSNLKLLETQTAGLRDRLRVQSQRANDLERQIIQIQGKLTSLLRERDACDMSYKGILNRIEEARLSADEDTTTVKVVERAHEPRVPVRPQKTRTLALALLFGLVAGVALGLIGDNLEDRITSSRDIEHEIGMRILGLVPHIPRGRRINLATAALHQSHEQLVEAFAGIRNLLESEQKKRTGSQAIVIASTAPQEGKTVTASNLAILFAKTGRKTLLIDMDLRRPRLGRIFQMPDENESLLHVLAEKDPGYFDILPFPTQCENLDVIASRPSNELRPALILGNSFVADFLDWVKARYQLIIIDSPPFGIVSDAVALASLTGNVIMVCRPDVTRKHTAKLAVRQFKEVGAEIIGAIISDVDVIRNPYFSNYHHHYSYKQYKKYYSHPGKDGTDE